MTLKVRCERTPNPRQLAWRGRIELTHSQLERFIKASASGSRDLSALNTVSTVRKGNDWDDETGEQHNASDGAGQTWRNGGGVGLFGYAQRGREIKATSRLLCEA